MKNGKSSIISWKSSKNKIEKLAYFTKNHLLCTAFAQSLSKKSYLICCVGNDKQFKIKKNGFN